jgi:hypothetical protein
MSLENAAVVMLALGLSAALAAVMIFARDPLMRFFAK